jgi:signal transduction histidine kinase
VVGLEVHRVPRKSNLGPLLLLAIATLAIYGLAFLLQTRIPALPPEFSRDTLDYPARVGAVVVESSDRLRFVAEGATLGEQLTIVDARETVHHVRTVHRRDLAYMIVIGINGLFFWAVTNFIFAPRLDRPGARSFFWIAFLYGLSVMIGGIYFPGNRSWLSYVMGYLQLAILAVLPLLFLHLSLTFPYRSGFLNRARWLMPALAAAAVGVVGWQVIAFQRYFLHPGPAAGALLDAPQIAADGLLVAETIAGASILSLRGLRSNDVLTKRQIYWLLLGFIVGSAPYVFLRTLPSMFGVNIPIPNHVDRLFELAIPMSFVLVVVRHRFLDIDVILRRGLMYTVLAGSAVIFYLLLWLALGGYFETRVTGRAGIVLLLAGLAAGLVFRPMRRWIGRRVDRTFFKLAYDYNRARQEMRAVLVGTGGQEELARVVARRVGHVLHPSMISVIVREGTECRVAGDLPAEVATEAFLNCEAQVDACPATFAAPGSTSVPERETDAFPQTLLAGGVVVVAPIRDETVLMGLIMLGRRKTERRYIDRDLEFLDDCAGVTGGALSRIELVQRVSAESFERRRLDELNTHKTEYLSRVSHDLRTPLSSIAWSAQNLSDGVVGALNAEQRQYVESIRIASGHLTQLVDNLLAVSRIDQIQEQLPTECVRLVQVIEDVVVTMRPVAEQESVSFELRSGTEAVAVAGHKGHLREIVTNLLDNAVRFSPPQSVVSVSVDDQDGKWVDIHIRDHGPGIDAAVLPTMFERHSQGARSPYSSRRGFGLGLHIVKSYVEQMGGSIEAMNHPDGGALFTCRLCRWPVPEEVGE